MGEAQPTVLLVEDNDLVRDTLKLMLANHGFVTVDVGTAARGLAAFEANPTVTLAILDMILPGESGLDLAAELERRRPGFRILYISGCCDSIAMESIARLAPELVLFKPFGEEILIQRVRGLLAPKEARPETGLGIAVAAMSSSAYPWERLVEASDELGAAGATIMSYRDTASGFAIAITHVAVLRVAELAYTFRFTGNAALPLALAVLPDDQSRALSLIESIGLGADIAPAA
jgi:DNA-binding NarL/FixJ family response regulator